MGYSTPKPPFDLKEFLSQPGTKRPRPKFGSRRPWSPPATKNESEPQLQGKPKA